MQYLFTDKFEEAEKIGDEDVAQILSLGQTFCSEKELDFISSIVLPPSRISFQNVFYFKAALEKLELNIPEINEQMSNYFKL